MLLQDKQIAIAGGGPGGLMLARLLQLKGARVTVYERDLNRDVRVQGATLDLHEESGLEALRRAGLIEEFRARYRPEAGRMRFVDPYAHIFLDDHAGEKGVAEDRPEIDRGPLREMLLESLQPGTVVWDSYVVSLDKQDTGWQLHFRNGRSAYADIVIAADGARSKVRPYVTCIRPVYSGITIVEGNVYEAATTAPALHKLVNGGKVFAFGEGQSLILSAKGDGSLSFYLGCKVEEGWAQQSGPDFCNKAAVHAWFNQAFGTWGEIWQELFAPDDVWFMPRPQYHFPLDQHWQTVPNITLLGDAAHCMPPYAGEGVNMALQDAFELAECLTGGGFKSLELAISEYEKEMLRRTSEVTRFSLENTEMLHSEGAIEKMLVVMKGA